MQLPRSYLVLACLAGALIVAGAIIVGVALIPVPAPVVGVASPPVQGPVAKVAPIPVEPLKELIWRDAPPSLPDVEPLPSGAIARLGAPGGPVHVLNCSPDGRFFVSVGSASPVGGPQCLRLWDVKSGQQLRVLGGHKSNIFCAAFSPDGNTLATTGMDDPLRRARPAVRISMPGHQIVLEVTLCLWDTATGKQIAEHRQCGDPRAVSWSQDGKYLATAGRWMNLWDVQQGKVVHEFVPPDELDRFDQFFQVAVSSDGSMVAGASQGGLSIWEAASGHLRLFIPMRLQWSLGLAFAADNKKLVVNAWRESLVQVWDLVTGQPLLKSASSPVARLQAISPDSKWLAWANEEGPRDKPTRQIHLRDLTTNHDVHTITMPEEVTSFVFTADGKGLLAGGQKGTVLRCAVPDGKLMHHYLEPSPIFGILPGPKGSVIALTRQPALHVWDVSTLQETKWAEFSLRPGERLLRLSANGRIFATVDDMRTLRLYDTASARLLGTNKQALANDEDEESLQLSLDGSRALVLTSGQFPNGKVVVWGTATGKVLHELQVTAGTTAAIFTADGQCVITAAENDNSFEAVKPRAWDLATGKMIKQFGVRTFDEQVEPSGGAIRNFRVLQMEPSPDGQWLAIFEQAMHYGHRRFSPANHVRILNWASGAELTSLGRGTPPHWVWLDATRNDGRSKSWPLVWSADSKCVACASNSELLVIDLGHRKVYGQWVQDLPPRHRVCQALHWLPDGRLLSGSDDGSMLLWIPAEMPAY
jgi:WD40 repeat protein